MKETLSLDEYLFFSHFMRGEDFTASPRDPHFIHLNVLEPLPRRLSLSYPAPQSSNNFSNPHHPRPSPQLPHN